ncbi:tRNA uridine(34) 5-carboxymethylaminomethyl modification radical SAM/GNAT enzyme Elp3 [Candidatus Woesearchaeota archaeon]|nr:tRNA uridine(34) 5-carboxymethylaminomethyl modification radical SAM/GNAT enzyme Elp3 [Candidatus Woesearchaeota archaeon]MBW3018112.1 tRNA uridine(34) 5-carboxymethylaminomethyl modification radical SAM/GNAT enzyme Elp3 [Candidatus Woesearchaeota archaeon]
MSEKTFYQEIEEILRKKKLSKLDLSKLKIRLCSKHKVINVPTDIQILLNIEETSKLKTKLRTKPGRTGSGVAVIAVMTEPFECPHGKCSYCPGGLKSVFGTVPQSYTGSEPATLRGIRNKYDAYLQVMNRLEQYVVMEHFPEKVELIIMGGTFISFPKKYREEFVLYALKAMNDFSEIFYKNGLLDISKFKKFFEMPGNMKDPSRVERIHERLLKIKGKSSLQKEQKRNETAQVRCVGLTIETRPDYALLKHANEMLRLGATRVEVGVQSVYDEPLQLIERGHDVATTVASFQILKDLGFKINAHYMPGLPSVDRKKDFEGMKMMFSDDRFRPDMLKIYPCMVVRGTKLYDQWKKGGYNPLSTSEAANLIASFKKFVPPYCRIMRVQRDIPSYQIDAGVHRTNLRQYIARIMETKGIKCKCIRCREPKGKGSGKKQIKLIEYDASLGKEFFISIEDDCFIYGFCRLRFPSTSLRKEITKNSALVRELHVYGSALKVDSKESKNKREDVQHKGLGKQLLDFAEKICLQNKKNKIVVISGIGAREYYKKLGYKLEGPYMIKKLK